MIELDTAAVRDVLIAKGDDRMPCVTAFQEASDIEVPDFPEDIDRVGAGGRTFWSVKGKDVAGLLENPAVIQRDGLAIGLAGSDALLEATDPLRPTIAFRTIGEKMCTLTLMAPEEIADEVQADLDRGNQKNERLIPVLTSFPRLLERCVAVRDLPITACLEAPAGSVEALIRLLDFRLGADLVVSGRTAARNQVRLLEGYDLYTAYPAIAWRDPAALPLPQPKSYLGVDRIDATLDVRVGQIDDPDAASGSLELLRDPKAARDKLAAEFGELFAAIENQDDSEACTGELADLVFASLVAARSRGIVLSLGDVISELSMRNMRSTAGGI